MPLRITPGLRAPRATAAPGAITAVPDTGRGVRATWRFTVLSIALYSVAVEAVVAVFLLADGQYGLQFPDVVLLLLSVTATVALVRFCWFFRPGLGGGLPPRAHSLWLVLPAAALYVMSVLEDHALWIGALPLWFAVNALAVVVRRTARVRILLAGVAALAGHGLLGMLLGQVPEGGFWDAGGGISLVIYAAMTPLLFVSGIWWWEIVVRLDDSRRTSGELAVAKERLRFASDLHDIQGHHLQVIALKTELAGRLLASDPAAARVQIDEAQDLARTALEDTRALVHGYRAVSLASEAENAAEVLGAAGITCSVEVRSEGMPENERTLFGLVIREATTNILRHSEATVVELVLTQAHGRFELEVRNDGVAGAQGSRTSSGTGIDGLRRRFEAVGGAVRAEFDGGRFTLTASAPHPVGRADRPADPAEGGAGQSDAGSPTSGSIQ